MPSVSNLLKLRRQIVVGVTKTDFVARTFPVLVFRSLWSEVKTAALNIVEDMACFALTLSGELCITVQKPCKSRPSSSEPLAHFTDHQGSRHVGAGHVHDRRLWSRDGLRLYRQKSVGRWRCPRRRELRADRHVRVNATPGAHRQTGKGWHFFAWCCLLPSCKASGSKWIDNFTVTWKTVFLPKLIGLRTYAVDKSHELEVDALLDHLFRHARRFLTSSPLRLTFDLLLLPSDVKRTMVNEFWRLRRSRCNSCIDSVAP